MEIINDIIYNEIGRLVLDSIDITKINFGEIINSKTYELLSEIHNVLKEYDITDQNADFNAIEKIVCIFEKHGISCGPCHDF